MEWESAQRYTFSGSEQKRLKNLEFNYKGWACISFAWKFIMLKCINMKCISIYAIAAKTSPLIICKI